MIGLLGVDHVVTRREAFVDAWVDAERDAGEALRAWRTAPRVGHEEAYAVYRAALEREERAAAMLTVAAEVQR